MRVLIACEESQRVCIEMRKLGHEAYSCDIQEPSGGHSEWHIQDDMLKTMNGERHAIKERWDLIIAHPPCTYLTVSGNRWFNEEKYGKSARERFRKRIEAASFFMEFAVNTNCDRIAIENPVGVMNSFYRKPDQIIEPYEYGHPVSKKNMFMAKRFARIASYKDCTA